MIHESDAPRIAAEVRARVLDERAVAAARGGQPLEQVLNETLFHEKRRLARANDRDDARAFYQDIAVRLARASDGELQRMLSSVVSRYIAEIEGHFNPRIYKLATRALPLGTGALLNAMSARRLFVNGTIPSFDNRLQVHGDTDLLHRLTERGTVLYVPTHSSNLDSIILGLGLYQRGLPPATYGAGLNLFENRIIGFFMQNLGAYTVDRLKTDPLYRDTLKAYATVVLEYGRPQLFFPGGTRNRSGAVERYLKKGLLGTALAAYRHGLQRGEDRRLYVVPVTVNYPLVLEASTLIDDYLQEAGRSRYIIMDDEFSQLERWAAYGRGLFALDMHIHLRFGAAFDPMGNDVSPSGDSLDPNGRVIDPSGYLREGGPFGEITEDPARDAEYTRMLARRVVDAYMENNIACSTHVVAYAVFHALWQQLQPRDVYRFLRALGAGDGAELHVDALLPTLETLLWQLRGMAKEGRIQLGPFVDEGSAETVLLRTQRSLASYHAHPVLEREGDLLRVGDPNLLFYYRNRLEGYGLLGAADLLSMKKEA